MKLPPEMYSLTRRRLIQNGLLLATGGTAVPGLWSRTSLDPATPVPDARQWTIGNDKITRTVAFHAGRGILTERLFDLATGAEFVPAGKLRPDMALEFSFVCNGNSCSGAQDHFDLVGGNEATIPHGRSLTIQLRHRRLSLDVAIVYRVYEGHSAVRKHLVLRNTGQTQLRFTHLNIEALGVALGGPENETTLLAQYGTIPREIFYTGRSEDAGLRLANARTGIGLAILREVPGYMKRTEIGGWDDPEQVKLGIMYDTDLMPFERSIGPGGEFTTAAVSLLTFRNGDGFRDPKWVLPSYTAGTLVRRVDAQGPPWIYNTWEPFQRRINRDIALELIEAAGAMGMDVFTIDDGWQQEYGENTVNLQSFPGGLQPIMDAVAAKGMRLGLWMPMAAIGRATADFRGNPEWASLDIEGKPKQTATMGGQKVVMCLASAFRDAAAARIIDAISRFRLAYVKLDITTIFNAYGEAPGCWAKGHDHGSWAESLIRIYEGIAYVTGKVYEKHPEVLLDLTFELWGQKHVIDAGLLAAGDLDWMSNIDDRQPDSAGPRQARQLLYQRAASMPVEAMLIGNMQADLPTIEESFATVIGSAPLLCGDLRKLSASDRLWYRGKIGWFKQLRGGTRISESFFPLGNWMQPSSTQWDGYARLARSGDGIIALFRNKSEAETAHVELPLLPPGKFSVRSVMTGREVGVVAQAEWVRGVPIRFEGEARVEVLEVRAVRG